MSASFLCAIHCAFAPLLIPLMAAFGFGFLWSHEFETGMIGLSLVVGGWSLTSSYVKVHRNWVPYVFLAAGIALIALTRFVFPEDWELIGLPSGAILIVIAHWLNYRLVQREHLACG
ncbi:MAG: MerC domain-containing protein [Calditrichaeota bacterium]|nr:MerC domain-containing protein [Calditrichota bacterium]